MNNTPISVLVAALTAVSQPVFAADETVSFDFYGQANVALRYADLSNSHETELVSYSSRVGVKGGSQLNKGMEVIYELEWQVDLTDLGGDDNLKSRNQFVGLKGHFGELTLGRRNTAVKYLQSGFDPFADYEGDIKNIFAGKNRTSDTISYFTPLFEEWQFAASYVLSEDDLVNDGKSLTVTYGDKKLKRTDFYVGAGIDRDINGRDVERVVALTKLATTTVGFMYQDQQRVDGSEQADGFVINAVHPLGDFSLKAQYQLLDTGHGDRSSMAAGIDYKLGAKTTLYGWYTGQDFDNLDVDQSFFAVGLLHKF
jgi:predicted porin